MRTYSHSANIFISQWVVLTDDLPKPKEKRRGHNEGTGYQRADGRWEWKITREDGTRKSFYAPTQRQPETRPLPGSGSWRMGLIPTMANLTVSAFLDTWLIDTAAAARPSVDPCELPQPHRDPYQAGDRPKKLRTLTVRDVEDMLNAIAAERVTRPDGATKQKTSDATVNLVRATLRTRSHLP